MFLVVNCCYIALCYLQSIALDNNHEYMLTTITSTMYIVCEKLN